MHILADSSHLYIPLLGILFFHMSSFPVSLAEGPPRKLSLADDKRITFAHARRPLALKCPIEMTESLTFVEWYRGNMSLYNEQGYVITPKGVLKIKSVSEQHAGTYTCLGINGYGNVAVNITLIVDDPEEENVNNTPANPNSANRVHVLPPTIRIRASKTNIVEDIGGQAIFHCVATGEPTPHIFWIKEDRLIHDVETELQRGKAHSTLKLRAVEKSDAGLYKCIAHNKMGDDQMDFTLHVTDPSSPPRIVNIEPQQVSVKEGATAVFWCEVNSKPGLKLHIKWLKKVHNKEIGEPIKIDDSNLFRSGSTYYRPLNNLSLNLSHGTSIHEGVSKSKLLIRNSCEEDSGTYVCLALNDKGFNFKNVTLTVIGKAPALSDPSYSAASSTYLVITITIGFVIFFATIVLVSHLYCRGRSPSKHIIVEAAGINNAECGNLKKSAAPMRKPHKKDLIVYPDITDPQSSSKLLSIDSIYTYERSETQLSKLGQMKGFSH